MILKAAIMAAFLFTCFLIVKTLQLVAENPGVDSVSDQRSSNDGIWVYLNPGWLTSDNMAGIHENTATDCLREVKHCRYDPAGWYARYIWAYPESTGLLPAG